MPLVCKCAYFNNLPTCGGGLERHVSPTAHYSSARNFPFFITHAWTVNLSMNWGHSVGWFWCCGVVYLSWRIPVIGFIPWQPNQLTIFPWPLFVGRLYIIYGEHPHASCVIYSPMSCTYFCGRSTMLTIFYLITVNCVHFSPGFISN